MDLEDELEMRMMMDEMMEDDFDGLLGMRQHRHRIIEHRLMRGRFDHR